MFSEHIFVIFWMWNMHRKINVDLNFLTNNLANISIALTNVRMTLMVKNLYKSTDFIFVEGS